MSETNTNPGTLFGGTWTQIKDRFILAAGDVYHNGDTGGSADAVVVNHTHKCKEYAQYPGWGDTANIRSRTLVHIEQDGHSVQYDDGIRQHTTDFWGGVTSEATDGESGVGKNMPPYLVVYMWKRTA